MQLAEDVCRFEKFVPLTACRLDGAGSSSSLASEAGGEQLKGLKGHAVSRLLPLPSPERRIEVW